MTEKNRLDVLLVEKNLVESRALAQRLIMAGKVRVNGEVALKASEKTPIDAEIVVAEGQKYVSRGGEKIEAALETFPVDVQGMVCADIGASTGGFTDCLLQHGAIKVYAIDVGYGILHWKLRNDPRVVVMERTNARYVEQLPEPVRLVTIDASFISLKVLLPVIPKWYGGSEGLLVTLIKPQFEAGREIVSRGEGVVRDEQVHADVLHNVLKAAQGFGFCPEKLIQSPLLGPKGNKEFLALYRYPGEANPDLEELIDRALHGGQVSE
jgi:23S rRNA (cytidine1920-2'-O)/16S rRNA (cytidine1409-2'-O)-methyltransferase